MKEGEYEMAREKVKGVDCRSDGRAIVCDAKVKPASVCARSKEPTTTKKKKKRCKQNVGGLNFITWKNVIFFIFPGRDFAQEIPGWEQSF